MFYFEEIDLLSNFSVSRVLLVIVDEKELPVPQDLKVK
jgi:hypothetical protein